MPWGTPTPRNTPMPRPSDEIVALAKRIMPGRAVLMPGEYDDWGEIRLDEPAGDLGLLPLVLKAHLRDDGTEQDAARREGRMPRTQGAHAAFAVAAWNMLLDAIAEGDGAPTMAMALAGMRADPPPGAHSERPARG